MHLKHHVMRDTIPVMALERGLRNIVLAGVFALPFVVLYVSSALFFPFITGKGFVFRLITEVVFFAWLALAAVNPEYRPRWNWVLLAFAFFLLVIGAAALFGVYPEKSIWSNFERMEGWVTLAHLFAYFLAAVSILNTERLWNALWQVSLSVAVFVGLYGMLQLAGFITINQGGVRLDATLGNAIYLAVYMLFHIFIAALVWGREKIEGKGIGNPAALFGAAAALQVFAVWHAYAVSQAHESGASVVLVIISLGVWLYAWMRSGSYALARVALALALALFTFILAFTLARGAMLGLAVGALVAALAYIVQAPRARLLKRIVVLLAVALVMAGGLWFARDAAWVQKVEPLQRLASISLSETTVTARFLNWGIAWEGFKERPVLGWGQENYAVVFDKYYDPRMYAQEPWFDRVHNAVFDWLIAGGVFGLLGYLALFAAALWALWRSPAFAAYERAILTGLLAGYFFNNLTVFDNITSYMLFVTVLAYIAARAHQGAPPLLEKHTLSRGALPILALFAVVGAWGVAWYVNADALAANRAIIRAISPQQDIMSNLAFFNEAIERDTFGTQEAREQLLQFASRVLAADFPQEVKREFLASAANEMRQQMEEMPHTLRFLLLFGGFLDSAGFHDEAKPVLERARELSPRKQAVLFQLGVNALSRDEANEALRHFEEAYNLAPAYREARVLYALTAFETGRNTLGDELLAPLVARGEAPDRRILSLLAGKRDFARIAGLYRGYAEQNQNDVQARVQYAIALYAAGQRAQAIEELEALREVAPASALDISALIAEMRAGTFNFE